MLDYISSRSDKKECRVRFLAFYTYFFWYCFILCSFLVFVTKYVSIIHENIIIISSSSGMRYFNSTFFFIHLCFVSCTANVFNVCWWESFWAYFFAIRRSFLMTSLTQICTRFLNILFQSYPVGYQTIFYEYIDSKREHRRLKWSQTISLF